MRPPYPLMSPDFCDRDELHMRLDALRTKAARRRAWHVAFDSSNDQRLRMLVRAVMLVCLGIVLGIAYVDSIDALAAWMAGR